MAEINETLELAEEKVRQAATSLRIVEKELELKEDKLIEAIEDYDTTREKLQREEFAKKELEWCHGCKQYHPKENISLLYTEIMEKQGYPGIYVPVRRLQSICKECREISLSRSYKTEEKFKCYLAEKRGEEFFIFVFEKWVKLSDPEDVSIKIEREDIPAVEFTVGEVIDYELNPLVLTIGDEKVIFK